MKFTTGRAMPQQASASSASSPSPSSHEESDSGTVTASENNRSYNLPPNQVQNLVQQNYRRIWNPAAWNPASSSSEDSNSEHSVVLNWLNDPRRFLCSAPLWQSSPRTTQTDHDSSDTEAGDEDRDSDNDSDCSVRYKRDPTRKYLWDLERAHERATIAANKDKTVGTMTKQTDPAGVERSRPLYQQLNNTEKKRVAYFYDSDIGNYAYVTGHPMKPHRIRLAHSLVMNYDIYKYLEIYVSRFCAQLAGETRDLLNAILCDSAPSLR